MPFFIRKSEEKLLGEKRKKHLNKKSGHKKKQKKDNVYQEVISSDEDLNEDGKGHIPEYSSDEETEQEKKLRLTKLYLEQIEKEEKEKNEVDDTQSAVSRRLREDALEEAGRLQKKRAHEYENVTPEVLCILRGHKLCVTCIVVSISEKFLFSASKDGSIIKWNIEEKKKSNVIPARKKISDDRHAGHTDKILTLALSSDDKYLASGCINNIINIWNPDTLEHLKTFKGHKAAITGLTFYKGSHQLVSASKDRSLKLFDLDEMGYVETMYGHQDAITSIDSFQGETVLTAGGRDNSVRIWKIVEESQLVFQASGASLDCVCVSSHQSFISGSDDGSLLLWGVNKKKPMSKISFAHGLDPETEEPNWIVSVCSLPNTDLIASGSKDGFIRLWKRDDANHALVPVTTIPQSGFINSLKFSPSGNYLVAAVGQEHRLGRWWRIKDAKNSVVIFSWKNKR